MLIRSGRSVFVPSMLAILLAACGSDATSPLASTVIVGDFGGQSARLHADSGGAMITRSCATVTIAQPLQTDAAGRFLVTGAQRSSAGAVPVNPPPGEPVTIEGLAVSTGGTRSIRLIIRPMVVDGPLPPGDTTFVFAGNPGNFPVCLAAARQ